MEEPGVPAEHLLAFVAGEGQKRVVNKDDWIIVEPGVADEHRHSSGAYRGREGISATLLVVYKGRLVPVRLLRHVFRILFLEG